MMGSNNTSTPAFYIPYYVLTIPTMDGYYWVSHDMKPLFAQARDCKYGCKVRTVPGSSHDWNVFDKFACVVEWMLSEDSSGEYDTLPMCCSTIELFIDIIRVWNAKQVLIFTDYDKTYDKAVNALQYVESEIQKWIKK